MTTNYPNLTCIMYMQIQDIHMQTALRIQIITPALNINYEYHNILGRDSTHDLSLVKDKNNDSGYQSESKEYKSTKKKWMHVFVMALSMF